MFIYPSIVGTAPARTGYGPNGLYVAIHKGHGETRIAKRKLALVMIC